jgi:chromosome partitioning protein
VPVARPLERRRRANLGELQADLRRGARARVLLGAVPSPLPRDEAPAVAQQWRRVLHEHGQPRHRPHGDDVVAAAALSSRPRLGPDREPSVYELLAGDAGLDEVTVPTRVAGLSLVPSTPDLAGANVELPRLPGSEGRLRDALAPARERYLFTLLDCPPSLGPLTVNALVAADKVLVPVQTEYFALEGLAGLLDTLALIQRELNPRLTVAGMLLTLHDGRTRLAQDVEREVREHFPELVFETVIPRNVRVGEAPSFGVPVIHHDPTCSGSTAYLRLAREVAERA